MINSKDGFTIVEILVVAAIISLLAFIALPNLLKNRISTNDAKAQSTLKSISTAMENYFAIQSQYPSSTNDLLSSSPPYISVDYFTGTHSGFTYAATLTGYTYDIVATPISTEQGTQPFTVSTGAILTAGP